MTSTIISLAAGILSFVLTVAILRKLIPVLASHKMGQKILEIGPRWHKSKEGTPTMGGLSFLISSTAVFILFILFTFIMESVNPQALPEFNIGKVIVTFLMALLNGIIGIIDDRAKFKKNMNEGLSAGQKYLLQLLISVLYVAAMQLFGYSGTSLHIPFTGINLELGILYYPIAVLILTGIINSVNLTDGIDGLASSVCCITGIFFLISSIITGLFSLKVISSLLIGITLGFLVYNFYPARVFMGDTGSLFLGGLVVGCAFLMDDPLIIILSGLLFLIESLSVMIQVSYFKITHGKRFFKMAPIHHHFEKCGWSEKKIVFIFTTFTILTSLISILSLIGK